MLAAQTYTPLRKTLNIFICIYLLYNIKDIQENS